MALGQHSASVGAILFLLIGFGLILTAEVTDYWSVFDLSPLPRVNAGLWRVCTEDVCVNKVDSISGISFNDLEAVRGLSITGLALGGIVVGAVILCLALSSNVSSPLIASVGAFLGVIVTVIALVVYATRFKEQNKVAGNWVLGWSYYLLIVGAHKIDNSENQKPKAYKIRIKQEPKQTTKPPPYENKLAPDMEVRPDAQEKKSETEGIQNQDKTGTKANEQKPPPYEKKRTPDMEVRPGAQEE
ncbi:hypothetical protein FSP39_001698 [Pinctada imbricata]|uniref:Uncharacterized protein n=1 Tax=Pinctada imbricata TaxID=66713 RepID=A0AA88YRV6_PINIB|nr:hypothetical protein FSP39_001698 [Pinctada imbricata]